MAKTDSPKSDSQRYSRGPLPGAKALSAVMKRIAGPDLRRKGFFESGLAAEWPAIVGAYLAERCAPEKLRWPRGKGTEATLELRIESAAAPEIQHLSPQITERINGYFGFSAVGQLKFIHAPLHPQTESQKPPARPLSDAEEQALQESLAKIEPGGLRAALEGLGRAVLSRAELGQENAPKKPDDRR
jgi:hypothetical protein